MPNSEDWFVFTEDMIIDLKHIIVKGMLGTKADDLYGLCTTGISTMIHAIGRKEPYGYVDSIFEQLEHIPDETEVNEALSLSQNSFSIYHDRHGWTGLVKIGKTVFTEKKIRIEIANLCKKSDHGSEKRLNKIMRAFKHHPEFENISNMSLPEFEKWNADNIENSEGFDSMEKRIWQGK